MMKSAAYATVILLAVALTACEGEGPKETGGTLLGAGLGALAGSAVGSGRGKLVGVAVGTLAGAMIGRSVGKSLDRADRAHMQRTSQQALEKSPSGKVTTWTNPDSGNSGTIVPQPAYKTADNTFCREYQQTVTIAGKTESAYGTACRQPDGSWKIVK